MDYKQFTNAILQGANVQAPSSSIPALANSFMGAFRNSAVSKAGKAQGTVATQRADDEERAREAARQAQIQKLKDSIDPSKYQKQRKDDGGFAFFDPSGKEIDVDTYAKRTGQRRVEVLQDSENPIDQQFIDDYSQMNELNQAVWRNDTEALSEFQRIYPDLFSGEAKPTPEDLNRKLLEKYPHMYGRGDYKKSYSNLGNPIFRSPASSATGGNGGGWSPS